MRIKIHGAGSIGNHLSHAARKLGWQVDLCDIDSAALERTRINIYPSRYQKWDSKIQLWHPDEAPKGGYDLIIVGTPPNTHMDIANRALEEKPKAILIEKPLCTPDLNHADEYVKRSNDLDIPTFIGYDHVLGEAAQHALKQWSENGKKTPLTLDAEFREHWGGIFAAHHWLNGPHETYLGQSRLGGGALGEHSHAINLWQHFAHQFNAGRVIKVQSMADMVNESETINYDRVSLMNFKTESGLIGRCVQDVITSPARKWARAQFGNGYIEWVCGKIPGVDAVHSKFNDEHESIYEVKKTRPDDFIIELSHISEMMENKKCHLSPLALRYGLDTMLVIAAAKLSAERERDIYIDYTKGYSINSLIEA